MKVCPKEREGLAAQILTRSQLVSSWDCQHPRFFGHAFIFNCTLVSDVIETIAELPDTLSVKSQRDFTAFCVTNLILTLWLWNVQNIKILFIKFCIKMTMQIFDSKLSDLLFKSYAMSRHIQFLFIKIIYIPLFHPL